MNRSCKFIVSLLVVLLGLSACAKSNETVVEETKLEVEPLKVSVEGSIFSGIKDEPVEMELVFSKDMLVEYDNNVYHSDLAQAGAILCGDTYFKTKDLEKGTQNRVLYEGEDVENYEITSLLEKLDFSDVRFVESFKQKEYDIDTNDSATFLMAYGDIDDKYDSFVFVIRGCYSAPEWISIFELGSNKSEYEELTGEHPEWSDHSLLKGATVAARRAYEFMSEFMGEHDDPDKENVVLVVGHSRGGAMANLIGKYLEEDDAVKSFTYTFNGLGVDTKELDKEYTTIYNLYDPRDIFANIFPFESEEVKRYGTDITVDVEGIAKVDEAYKELTGRDMTSCMSLEDLEEYKKVFANRFSDRESLYESRSIMESFDSLDEANARLEEITKLMGAEEGLGLGVLCSVSDVESADGVYTLTISYCDGAWMQCISKILAFGNAGYEATVSLFKGDEEGVKVADFLRDHLSKVNGGHQLINDYFVAGLN